MDERFQLFTVLITSINRSIRRIKTEEMAEFELKSHHVSCLYYLYKEGALTAKELCDICEEDKANISRSIKDLESRGYLFCNTKRMKRYQSPLELTEQGKLLAARIEAKVNHVLSIASKGLSDEERQMMYHCLETIDQNLQSICNQYDK